MVGYEVPDSHPHSKSTNIKDQCVFMRTREISYEAAAIEQTRTQEKDSENRRKFHECFPPPFLSAAMWSGGT